MKRFCSTLLILCFLLSLCACCKPDRVRDFSDDTQSTTLPSNQATNSSETLQTEIVQTTSSITPILYKVTDQNGNVVWLFGSIHVGQEHYYPLPDYITSAYENADALAVECDVVAFSSDIGAQTDALMQLVYLDGSRISAHVPEELYTQAVEILKECGLYMSALDMYYPVLWSNFIDTSLYESFGVDSNLGLDMHFLNDAHGTGKEILEVESVEFQYGMMGGFSEELQVLLLESSIYSYENPEESRLQLTELADAWAAGDEETLVALLNEEPEFESEEEVLLYAEYNNAMLTQRNLSMADYAEASLTSGKEVFICVGAAHVVGPGAMAELLAQRGYTVERITP